MTPPLLTVSEVAQALQVSPRTVRRLVALRKIETVRPAGLKVVRITRAEVERVIAEGVQPTARYWKERRRA